MFAKFVVYATYNESVGRTNFFSKRPMDFKVTTNLPIQKASNLPTETLGKNATMAFQLKSGDLTKWQPPHTHYYLENQTISKNVKSAFSK